MTDCIFCQIAQGKLKAEVVFESPAAIAFLDKYPVARGHVVVIPTAHAATLTELADDAVGGLCAPSSTVSRCTRTDACIRTTGRASNDCAAMARADRLRSSASPAAKTASWNTGSRNRRMAQPLPW